MENQRVKDTVNALEKKDIKELARLLTESHISSRDNLGVSCGEIDEIHSLAMANGALGGRLSGAGWGGRCILYRS